jgi:hypothetical protein
MNKYIRVHLKVIKIFTDSRLDAFFSNRFDANRILLVNTAILPICMFMIPMCKALTSLAFILAIMGLNMGCIDCLANLQMINIHGIGVAPFLHVNFTTIF